jgi:rhamnogalacturonyl hydrolase YesR
LYDVPRTRSGAISHRAADAEYWADGVYMGFPFIAYAGGVTGNQTLLQLAYDNVRLYRDALLLPGPTGPLWGHLFDDESQQFWDAGLWATGNGWAALGAVNVAATIAKTSFAGAMAPQLANLTAWVGEIVNGTFHAAVSTFPSGSCMRLT